MVRDKSPCASWRKQKRRFTKMRQMEGGEDKDKMDVTTPPGVCQGHVSDFTVQGAKDFEVIIIIKAIIVME
ncbi:hypothetical protein CEXT_285251 [Caerostris extrusa]|uniref:Uncharacterized protein n=1 Tax=Caerostris extrusa TaxID=172846 RepID=A0AAV4VAN1_CAEEX|nr:hypothetical protein CEXT_285251 [Caerostris extrusa]